MQAWQHLRFDGVRETGGDIGVAGLAFARRMLRNTHDHREALRAFAERRPPEYHNV